jgi:hypothetical protein
MEFVSLLVSLYVQDAVTHKQDPHYKKQRSILHNAFSPRAQVSFAVFPSLAKRRNSYEQTYNQCWFYIKMTLVQQNSTLLADIQIISLQSIIQLKSLILSIKKPARSG